MVRIRDFYLKYLRRSCVSIEEALDSYTYITQGDVRRASRRYKFCDNGHWLQESSMLGSFWREDCVTSYCLSAVSLDLFSFRYKSMDP